MLSISLYNDVLVDFILITIRFILFNYLKYKEISIITFNEVY